MSAIDLHARASKDFEAKLAEMLTEWTKGAEADAKAMLSARFGAIGR